MRDIETKEDIVILVDSFYKRVQENTLLAPVFSASIKDNWEEHHDKLYRFWQTVLFKEKTYSGRPHKKHERMIVSRQHFDTWLEIWKQTVDELFAGTTADRAKFRGETMADSFFERLQEKH